MFRNSDGGSSKPYHLTAMDRHPLDKGLSMNLRQNILSFILVTSFASCTDPISKSIPTEKSADTSITSVINSIEIDTIKYIWIYDYADEIPVRLTDVNPDTLTPEKLIYLINKFRGQDKIILKLVKVSRDTIYVAIKESTYLTQSMGTSGADDYVSTTVYTLTELKDIEYVNLNFTEGDHARPGTYSRQYYIDRSNTATIHK
jgi:hypothetical protein